ncbi:MAG: hypothetical protein JWM47_3788 [Acidimicrobiales bacterium]|nr:hypothetical protein [Acidimicrobiales bacterium]
MSAVAAKAPPMQRRPVLADRRLDRRLDLQGFATVPVLDQAEAAALRAAFTELRGSEGSGFEADLNNPDPQHRARVAAVLAPRLAPALQRIFVGHEPFLWNFLCKWPHTDEELYLHRDWMFVDERTGARSCSLWIALQDITGHNGQLRVLPGSHRVDRGDRVLSGTELAPSWVERGEVVDARLVSLPLRAGEAVVLDHALVHCSYGNHTDEPRVAVGCALRPSSEPLVHFRRRSDRVAERYDVDDDFFVTYTPGALTEAPPDRPLAEVIDLPEHEEVDPDELARRLAQATSLTRRAQTLLARRPGRQPSGR